MPATAWPFITHDASGVAIIEGTQTYVIEVALDRLAHEWNAEDRQIDGGLNRADEICNRRVTFFMRKILHKSAMNEL